MYILEAILLFYDQECSYTCNKLHKITEYQNSQYCSAKTTQYVQHCQHLQRKSSLSISSKTLMIINLFMGGNNILSEMNFKKCHLRSNIPNTTKNTLHLFHRISTEMLLEKTRCSWGSYRTNLEVFGYYFWLNTLLSVWYSFLKQQHFLEKFTAKLHRTLW